MEKSNVKKIKVTVEVKGLESLEEKIKELIEQTLTYEVKVGNK